jgi:capsular polysaccharide biosynthesis protein
MNKEFNLIEAIRIIIKWRIHIIVLTITAAIVSAIVALFVLDEYFLSWSTFYPTNQALSDRAAIFNTDVSAQLEYFGSKSDVNRVLTIANSVPVIESIIDSFHLAEHYKIDTTKKYWKTRVRKKFEKNYAAIKTEHEAVEISLYDTDPKMAADIVNTIVHKVDALNEQHVNESKQKLFGLLTKQIDELQQRVNGYVDTLASLGQQYKIKVSVGNEGTVIVEGNDYKAVQQYKALQARQTNAMRELNNLVNINGQMDVSLKNSETSLFVLEKAFPADRRERPVRWLVVTVTTLMTLFIAIIGVLFIEQVREIREQL